MTYKVYPPTNKCRLPANAAERWRDLCYRCRTSKRAVTLNDADKVLLIMLERTLDSILEIGNAAIDVANRFQYLDLPDDLLPELARVQGAYATFLRERADLEKIDPDLKLHAK